MNFQFFSNDKAVNFIDYQSYLLKNEPSVFVIALNNFNEDILRKASKNEKGYIWNLENNVFKIENPERIYAFELDGKYQRFIDRLVDSGNNEVIMSF